MTAKDAHKGPRPAHPKSSRGGGAPSVRNLVEARKVRSPFGTRVARSITCSACGAEDTIHFAPRPDQAPLCRRCAAERLGVVDREANLLAEHRERCERCGLFVPKVCKFEDPLRCSEHARALALRQGERAKSASRGKSGILRVRGPQKG